MAARLLALTLALAALAANAADPWKKNAPALLKADEAFQLMPVEARGKTLRVEWQVAPGYYLYLNKLKFEPLGAKAVAVKLPKGEAHEDEHFGKVEIVRAGRLAAEITVDKLPKQIKLGYQGCAEIGVCLPPQTRTVEVIALP